MSWVTETLSTIKAMRTPENAPLLPEFPRIDIKEIPPASILLFYGIPGTLVTQRLGVNKFGVPYHPPFHAALMMRDGIFHNVGKFRTDKLLSDELKSTRRIDVITYEMTDEQRSEIMRATELDTSTPHTGLEVSDYGIGTFLNFGFSFVGHSKQPICSEDVVKLLAVGGVKCSNNEPKESAPWDLQLFANDNPKSKQYTLHVGKDYHK